MAAGQIRVLTDEQRIVTCGDCRKFERDTEGCSFNIATGEYFMGVCRDGLHPDSPRKQFANKPRRCNRFRAK